MEDIYNLDFVEEMLEDDEISAEEAAFMIGYAGQMDVLLDSIIQLKAKNKVKKFKN